MAIPEEFTAKFKNEEQFRDGFLVPLLQRMGFNVVVNYHGTREYGKDLIFGEIDAFGHVLYHGLQAKYEASIGQSAAEGMIEDCRQAFRHSFDHPQTGARERIDRFYFVNGGSISEQARENYYAELMTPHGGQIRLLDGKALIALDRLAAYRGVENVGQLLAGLRLECLYNLQILPVIVRDLSAKLSEETMPLPNERIRTFTITSYLSRPFPVNGISLDTIHLLWHQSDTGNRMLNWIGEPLRLESNRVALIQEFLRFEKLMAAGWFGLLTGIQSTLLSLGPLATM